MSKHRKKLDKLLGLEEQEKKELIDALLDDIHTWDDATVREYAKNCMEAHLKTKTLDQLKTACEQQLLMEFDEEE